LAERYPGGAVHDAGHTQVPAGSLTVVPVPAGTAETEHLLASLEPW
jgi:peptidyl-tRNA hydrolase